MVLFVLAVKVAHAGLDKAGSEIDGVGHEGTAEDGAGLVEALADEDFLRGEKAVEDVADGLRDVGELDAEAYEDPEDKDCDEELEGAEGAEGSVRAVEDEDDEGVCR